MKVALLLHGQARKLKEGYDSLYEHILKKYDVDVYSQVWWDEEIERNGYRGSKGYFKIEKDTPNLIVNYYQPKEMLVQKNFNIYDGDNFENSEIFIEYPQFKNFNWPSREHFLSQLLSIKNVSNLVNWEEYDFIIKSRYDIKLDSVPNLFELDGTKFYPAQHKDGSLISKDNFFCDVCFILPNDMKKFLEVFDGLTENDIFDFGVSPEDIFAKWLDKLNHKDRLVKLPNEFVYI
jgi:hypothetical protein